MEPFVALAPELRAAGPQSLSSSPVNHGRLLAPCQCAQCNQANAADRKFCSNCGTALWEPCLTCQASNGAWEKFCGVCGTSLSDQVERQLDQLQAQESQAREYRAECRHREAAVMLRSISISPHPRLAMHIERLHRMAQEITDEHQRLEQSRQAKFAQAQLAMSGKDYAGAIACLEQVHANLETPEMQQLLEQAVSAQSEILALAAEIKVAVAERRLAGLLVKVERLLELRPDHADARSLCHRLAQIQQRSQEGQREQLVRAAQIKLAMQLYDEAVQTLEQINEQVRTPEINKLLEQARDRAQEASWLLQDLREAAVLDDFHPSLAERLLKLKPKDEQIARLVQRIRQQHDARKARHLPGQNTLLVSSPRETPFGCPVDALRGFRRIEAERITHRQEYVDNPSAFYVACGLALQALEKAAVQVNLLPATKQNNLSRWAGALLKKRGNGAWGLDVGTHSLKAVRLTLDAENPQDKRAKKTRVIISACEIIEYPLPLNHPEAEQEKSVRQALQKLRERHKLDEDSICVGYPGQKTLARFLKIPPTEKQKIPELVAYEAKRQIPFEIDSVTWGYQVISNLQQGERAHGHDIGIFALRTLEATQFLYPFGELEIKVDVLQSASVALHNYVHFDRLGPNLAEIVPDSAETVARPVELPREELATLDIGSDTTNLVISGRDFLWLRSLPVGAHHFNRALIAELNLTYAQGEQLKRNPLKLPFVHKTYQAMQPAFRSLMAEIARSLTYFSNTYHDRRIGQIQVIGNGAKLHGLLRILRTPLPGTAPGAK